MNVYEISLPTPFERRILAQEAPGGPPETIELVVPTLTRPGEPFRIRLAVLDASGYPSVEFDGAVEVDLSPACPPRVRVDFEKGRPAVAAVSGIILPSTGYFRFPALLHGKRFHSNATRCATDAQPAIFWGDPHIHTVLSNCHADRCRSADFGYVAGRHVTGLDFVGEADHVSNNRSSLGQWRELVLAANRHDDPPGFVTLPCYEASLRGGSGGDNNVYLRRWLDLFVDEHDAGTVKTLCEKLMGTLSPQDFFVVPHHTARVGKHGEISDAIYPGEALMPVVEIHSKWGTSEYRGNPNPLLDVHPGPSHVVDFLNRGLRLGFVAGTDSHATIPAGFGRDAEHLHALPGLTAVRAETLTRDTVFDGIRTRRCYAASGERIFLDVHVGDVAMGMKAAWRPLGKPRNIRVAVAAKHDIDTIEVIRNGVVLHTVKPGSWNHEFAFTDRGSLAKNGLDSIHMGRFSYYYVRVACASGAQAWSSPTWLTLE